MLRRGSGCSRLSQRRLRLSRPRWHPYGAVEVDGRLIARLTQVGHGFVPDLAMEGMVRQAFIGSRLIFLATRILQRGVRVITGRWSACEMGN